MEQDYSYILIKKIMSLSGYFKNDNMNIIRDNKIFTKKNDEILNLLKLEVIPDVFKKEIFRTN